MKQWILHPLLSCSKQGKIVQLQQKCSRGNKIAPLGPLTKQGTLPNEGNFIAPQVHIQQLYLVLYFIAQLQSNFLYKWQVKGCIKKCSKVELYNKVITFWNFFLHSAPFEQTSQICTFCWILAQCILQPNRFMGMLWSRVFYHISSQTLWASYPLFDPSVFHSIKKSFWKDPYEKPSLGNCLWFMLLADNTVVRVRLEWALMASFLLAVQFNLFFWRLYFLKTTILNIKFFDRHKLFGHKVMLP